ncbi:MAG: hypothetical protein KKA28_06275 [Planctomycetes bacterium]|nr:hypothetical protein [Planctomycetota bacterium]MCG2684178.1 hypothetical protein [Planctomycetales bacterium]
MARKERTTGLNRNSSTSMGEEKGGRKRCQEEKGVRTIFLKKWLFEQRSPVENSSDTFFFPVLTAQRGAAAACADRGIAPADVALPREESVRE